MLSTYYIFFILIFIIIIYYLFSYLFSVKNNNALLSINTNINKILTNKLGDFWYFNPLNKLNTLNVNYKLIFNLIYILLALNIAYNYELLKDLEEIFNLNFINNYIESNKLIIMKLLILIIYVIITFL